MRKLSCDGESSGFEIETVPFISIPGISVRFLDREALLFFSTGPATQPREGITAATPEAAVKKADFRIKFLRSMLFLQFAFIIKDG